MLILSFNPGEALMIGDEITIRVLNVDERQGQIKIGIDAPISIEVHRQEVYKRINAAKRGVAISYKPRAKVLHLDKA